MTAPTHAPAAPEIGSLRDCVTQLQAAVAAVRGRFGDVPAVRRLVGDVERLDLDAADLDGLAAATGNPGGATGGDTAGAVHLIDDSAPDPAMWAGCDDEGLGGYHR